MDALADATKILSVGLSIASFTVCSFRRSPFSECAILLKGYRSGQAAGESLPVGRRPEAFDGSLGARQFKVSSEDRAILEEQKRDFINPLHS